MHFCRGIKNKIGLHKMLSYNYDAITVVLIKNKPNKEN